MRKIIVLAFISLYGVIQAPGGPQEDTDGSFKYGGWVAPYFDERSGARGTISSDDGVCREYL